MADGAIDRWIGREERRVDIVTAAPLARLAALLDRDAPPPGAALPPLAHWLFHLPDARQSALGADGHPADGGFLPVLPATRRMWVGGRLRFLAPLRLGDTIERVSRIATIESKAAGTMTLVTVRHEIAADGRAAVEEDQVLAFLPETRGIAPAAAAVARADETRARRMTANSVLLFRFSALTFNAHRIHYDAPYARDVEGYPGLVVHGPLQAMLLADAWRSRHGTLGTFEYRARAPLFADVPFDLCTAADDAWIRDVDGRTTMTATASAGTAR